MFHRTTMLLLLSVLSGIIPGLLQAQESKSDSALAKLLQEHRYTLALEDGGLVGPGADFLLREGKQAHFFMIGEEHGVADVPEFTSALFRALRPHGYEHLVIETSPSTATLLDRTARRGRDSLAALYRRHPLGVPFYNWHEEAQLLVDALQGAGPGPVLMGVDYEFALADVLWLSELERRARTAEARALVRRYREQAETGQRGLTEDGNPSRLFLATARPEDYAALRTAFARDTAAVALVNWLEASADVWRLQFSGENYRSNLARTDLIRSAFAEGYRRAKGDRPVGPKAVLKFGGNHLFRGRTPMNVFDVGTMAAMLAEYEGGHAFNVMAVAGPGTQQTFFQPTGSGTKPVELAAWAAPLYRAADGKQWTLFDLRPLRPHLDAGRLQLDPELARLVWGYDAYLVLTGSRPAAFDAILPPK